MDSLSKLTTIEQLRERLGEEFDAEPERQRLFYRGKQVSTSRVVVDTTITLHMREQRDPYLTRGGVEVAISAGSCNCICLPRAW